MRSLLIAPADEQRLGEALESEADAVVVDLASAETATKAGARAIAARFLKDVRGKRIGNLIIVRASALNSHEIDADLDEVMSAAPDAILLPGSLGAPSVQQLSAKLAVREAKFSLPDGATRIIAVADTAQSLFNMGSYRGASARLMGIAWSAHALRADIGAETDRDRLGDYYGSCHLARELTLLAATSAGVPAIDAIFPNVGDLPGLRAEATAARRDGFLGKLAISHAQSAIINAAFPSRSLPPEL